MRGIRRSLGKPRGTAAKIACPRHPTRWPLTRIRTRRLLSIPQWTTDRPYFCVPARVFSARSSKTKPMPRVLPTQRASAGRGQARRRALRQQVQRRVRCSHPQARPSTQGLIRLYDQYHCVRTARMTPSFVRRIGLAATVICEHLSKLLQRRRAVQSHVRQEEIRRDGEGK